MSVVLSTENKKQLMVPHGFSVLSETAFVMYKVEQLYRKEIERGIRFDDPSLAIDCQLRPYEIIVSDKDLVLLGFKDIDWEF